VPARLEGQVLIPVLGGSVAGVMAAALAGRPPRDAGDPIPAAGAELAPVVPHPGKIFCVGLNYRDHIAETGQQVPKYPTLFAKFADALIGPADDLTLPSVSSAVDYEVELALVIGAPLRRAGEAEALAAIGGYTVANDVSMRDWQLRTGEWLQGKTFEASTPLGPYLVTPDEIDHARDLAITCRVDDEVRQESSTAELVFGPAAVAAYISQFTSLRPGDVILTGTPGGVGMARTPPAYLRPGQTVRSAIAGLGECVTRCVPDQDG
jgi:acylpyruvate hydrolase